MKVTDLAYIAGFVDGEGCVRVNNNGSIELSVINTSLATLEFIKERLGGVVGARKQKVNKSQYHYRIYGAKAAEALRSLAPYLQEKLEQVELTLGWFVDRGRFTPIHTENKRGRYTHPEREQALKEVQKQLSDMKRVSS